MREEHTIHLVEIPLGGKEGFTWNRLHELREEVCETLAKEEIEGRRKSLQTRLRKVDDALDRLMAGSYGHCSRCGRAIDETKLDIDPAVEFCGDCPNRQPANIEAEARGHLRGLALMI